jgi:hypothetical protein
MKHPTRLSNNIVDLRGISLQDQPLPYTQANLDSDIGLTLMFIGAILIAIGVYSHLEKAFTNNRLIYSRY